MIIKKVKQKSHEVKMSRREQFAAFKANIRADWDKKFPKLDKDIDDTNIDTANTSIEEQKTFSARRMIIFRGIGLVFVALGYVLYNTLSYLYMLIAAFIISLALEGVITFRSRLTRSRGIGTLMAYLLTILFLLSGFLIVVPFLLSRGTQILQSIISFAQGIQADILEQGIDAYIRGIRRIPDFMEDEILGYIKATNSASLIQALTDNLGNIVNLSSSYLKTIGEYAVNLFGGIFGAAGKLVILFTLSVFFSISHFEVKYTLKYFFRKMKNSKQRIDEVYGGVSSRLKSQLLLCVFIGGASYLGLRILSRIGFDLPQKGVLALLAGLFEIIPYLGPFLGGLPAAIFGLMLYGFPGFIAVVILYTIIQQTEEKILIPVLMSKTLGVNPLLVFVCMLFGGLVMGVFGIVLAVPIAVIISIIFKTPFPENENLPPFEKEIEKSESLPKKKPTLKTKK